MTDTPRFRPRERSLLRNRDFARLWTAESVSQLGSQVSLLALPLLAIKTLHASTFAVSALSAIALFSIPVAWWLGILALAQLFVVVFITGVLTVFFDVAYQSYLPALVDADQLADGNAKLEISRSGAQIAGPGLAGTLVDLLGAPVAVVADAVSFVLSAISVLFIRRPEPPVEVHESGAHPTMRSEIGEGLRYVLGHRSLRLIAGCTATSNYFNSMLQPVLLLYLARQLDWSAGLIGLMFMLANIGFLVSAAMSARVQRWLDLGRTIWISALVCELGGFIVGFSPGSHAFAWIVGGTLLTALGNPIYNIAQVSYRQAITPNRMLGRMNATMRFMVWGTMPLGSLSAGVLGTVFGLRTTMMIAGSGGLLAILFVIATPVRTLRDADTAALTAPA